MEKKRVLKLDRIMIACILLGILILLCSFFWFHKNEDNELKIKKGQAYIASSTLKLDIYNDMFEKVGEIVRGTIVEVNGKKIVDEKTNKEYKKINWDKNTYYVEEQYLVDDIKKVVLEKKLYVRTPVTVYKDSTSSKIESMVKKGEEVEITGFDELKEDGSVTRYEIKYQNKKGFVYSKYLVSTKEEALKNYDENGMYQVHAKRKDTQGGGSGANLDYYPYEKANFEENKMPDEVRSLYLNGASLSKVDSYIALAKKSNINAFVVDIKDNTAPAYKSLVMKEMSPTNYEKAGYSMEEYKGYIKKLKDNGFYVIGRITTFKDNYYVKDHPETAIMDAKTKKPYNHDGSYWPSAFQRSIWEFNVELAKEAVKEMGFHEIQFDYVRFPDRTYSLESNGTLDMNNPYKEEKAQAIQSFLMYACDELHPLGAYVSADVFGESAHNYVTGYGQYWAAISNVVDVISAMPYPDHFGAHEYGINEIVWTVPYKLLNTWGKTFVAVHQKEIPTPAKVRTWIQAYDTIRSPYITYDASKISDQIKGLYDAGLSDGYMTWNSASSLSKYEQIAPAFKKEYKRG